jgi:Recombinase
MRGKDKSGANGKPIKTLVECAAEQDVMTLMRTLRASGMTLQAIAADLDSRGIKRREGGKWDYQFIGQLLNKSA